MLARFLLRLVLGPWIGHGRATELFLAMVCLFYGVELALFPRIIVESQATRDLFWAGYGHYVAWPFLFKAGFTGVGLAFNIWAYPGAKELRIVGSVIGSAIWVCLAYRFIAVDATGAVGFPFVVAAEIFSLRIMILALLDLPAPGAKGAL